jgi:nitrous oxidase accessory protein NosD
MEAACTDAAGRSTTDATKLNVNEGSLGLGGKFGGVDAKLIPGVYTLGLSVTIDKTIYFEGNDEDVFIIKMTGNLLQVKNIQVILNGALAKYI